MKKIATIIFLLLSLVLVAYTQSLPDSIIKRMDEVLDKWKTTTGPGCVIAIVRANQLVYSKGFGMANLEDGVPNTPASIYYLASVSKQFTGYAIALLMKENRVLADEDIHTYLPRLPPFPYKVKVAHLLNHTSGIREQMMLMPFAGLPVSGIFSQDMALNLITKQHTLNFIPGEKFSYCNSNYLLLAKIIESVSGKSFPAFVDSAIFKPLGMYHSKFVASPEEIIQGRADSYALSNSAYVNVPHNIYTMGDGGMFSCANDLAKWMINLYHPFVGDQQDIKRLTKTGMLTNGNPLTYGMGIISDVYRGQKRLSHKGGLAGYKNYLAVYPELETGIVILTNGDDGPKTTLTMNELAELLIPVHHSVVTTPKNSVSEVFQITDTLTVKQLSGNYIARDGTVQNIHWKAHSLYAGDDRLIPVSKDVFYVNDNPQVSYQFAHTSAPTFQLKTESPNNPVLFKREETSVLSLKDLKNYEGTYHSTEIDFDFNLNLTDGKLFMTNSRYGSIPITLSGRDHLYAELYFMDHLFVIRNKKNEVTGLELVRGDFEGLIFNKSNHR